ncbi:MAG: DUF1553 domain-containing protein [Planctomycetota bacterium]
MKVFLTRFVTTALVLVLSAPVQAEEAERISYNRDIRPILSDKCFSCHGPDNQHRAADLRLDVTEDGDDFFGAYLAIEPGDIDASDLVDRIYHKDPKVVMPPPNSHLTMTDAEKKLLVEWIKQGAEYESHWSFVAPSKPKLPEVDGDDWPRNNIDTFVLRKLKANQLKPSPEASKQTLLRRLTLDLTGLPPTTQEIDAFLADTSDDAYEKVVERLLTSKHFGERMALTWLDAARYADTNGFSIDDHRDMWLWREWVIDAYNKNMPYDQFVVEQLAGDLLPGATETTRVATGFLRNAMNTHEGGTIPEEYRVTYIADKINTVSTVFMGLTMQCAQCHDHKYDPISQQDYFSFYAFFDTADIRGTGATNANTAPIIRTSGQLTSDEQFKADIRNRMATLERYLIHPPELVEDRAKWEQPAKDGAEGELAAVLAVSPIDRTDEQWGVINEAFGKTTELWERHINTIKREIAVLRGDLKAGQASVMVMQEQGPKQTYVLTRGEYNNPDKNQPVSAGVPGVLPPLPTKQPEPVKEQHKLLPWQSAKWVWDNANAAKAEQDNQPRYFRLVFELDEVPSKAILRATADNRCTTYLNGRKLGTNDPWMTPARYDVAKHLVKGKNVIAIKAVNAGGSAGMLASLILDDEREIGSDKAWKVSMQAGEQWTGVRFDDSQWPASKELGPASMGPWKIGSGVALKVSAVANRLDLAHWLIEPSHPLTARVAVNRLWQQFVGQGLVTTPNDFGMQGAYPTHRGLLDYLASEYIESGWDTKRLIKQIVMSATYRQSSSAPRGLYQQDPGNALLARASRYRLPAEVIRDNALAIAGKLDTRVGGPSVYPSQPHGLWREVSHFGYPSAFTAQAFYPSDESGLTRRSMYTFWKRTSPPPSLTAFDAPTREVCTVDRPRTNTPLQALVLLNDPEYVDAALALAQRAMTRANSYESKIQTMFRRATGRQASEDELSALMQHFRQATATYFEDLDATEDIVGNDADSPVLLAGLTSVATIILNLDEVITRE